MLPVKISYYTFQSGSSYKNLVFLNFKKIALECESLGNELVFMLMLKDILARVWKNTGKKRLGK